MSGGVDSSVAAAILLEQGYEVHGVTMEIWPALEDGETIATGCCSVSAIDDAREIANILGIPFYVWNFQDEFENTVINPFISEYIKGRTPNPCVRCNKTIKFEALLSRALKEGFDYIATGHYGRIEKQSNGRYALLKSSIIEKDQSYALYGITQEQLAHLLLPVVDMSKDEVREYAKNKGLPVFNKPDSQEICFVRDNDYAGFINRAGHPSIPGDFVDTDGNVIGKHKGVLHYTVGQRKGLGMTFGKPMFVVKVDAENNKVVLGDNEDTFTDSLTAHDLNWIATPDVEDGMMFDTKIRYNGPSTKAKLTKQDDGVLVEFEKNVRAVTPGQSVVFYDGDIVVGGGIID